MQVQQAQLQVQGCLEAVSAQVNLVQVQQPRTWVLGHLEALMLLLGVNLVQVQQARTWVLGHLQTQMLLLAAV
jgi:hypothetical protein